MSTIDDAQKPIDGPKRTPGRPRSEATRRAILDAALHLFDTEPYRDISIDRIAATAKVGKQSIYRWWDSRANLVLDAYLERASRQVAPAVATGNVFADLEDYLKRLFQTLREPRAAASVRSLIAEAQFCPDFRRKFHKKFLAKRRTAIDDLLRHGIESAQIKPGSDVDAIMDIVYGAFWYRLLSGTKRPYDDAYAELICDMVRAHFASAQNDARPPVRSPLSMFEA
jgi:AcrR family transcriptional regulator